MPVEGSHGGAFRVEPHRLHRSEIESVLEVVGDFLVNKNDNFQEFMRNGEPNFRDYGGKKTGVRSFRDARASLRDVEVERLLKKDGEKVLVEAAATHSMDRYSGSETDTPLQDFYGAGEVKCFRSYNKRLDGNRTRGYKLPKTLEKLSVVTVAVEKDGSECLLSFALVDNKVYSTQKVFFAMLYVAIEIEGVDTPSKLETWIKKHNYGSRNLDCFLSVTGGKPPRANPSANPNPPISEDTRQKLDEILAAIEGMQDGVFQQVVKFAMGSAENSNVTLVEDMTRSQSIPGRPRNPRGLC